MRYKNKNAAELAMYLVNLKRGDGEKREQRVYRCRYCKGWHITSQAFQPSKKQTKKFNRR